MSDINHNIDPNDSIRRFEAAKERYKATLGSQPEIMADDTQQDVVNKNLIEFLKESKNNTGGLDIPVPLPVRPIDPLAVSNNAALKDLNKSVKAAAVPIPLKIDDTNISSEFTLLNATAILKNIDEHIVALDKDFGTDISDLTNVMKEGLLNEKAEDKSQKGWFARITGNVLSYFRSVKPQFESLADTITTLTTPISKHGEETVVFLKKILSAQLRMVAQMQTSAVNSARDLLDKRFMTSGGGFIDRDTIGNEFIDNESERPGALKGLSKTLIPDGTRMRSVIEFTKTIGGFFGTIGKFGSEFLKSNFGRTIGITGNILTRLPVIGKVITMIGGLSGFLAGLAGLAVLAPLYSAFRNPEQLMGYLGAFGTLFTENIIPTMKWITVEIVPVLAAAFAGLAYVADQLLSTVGTFINEGAIYVLGTLLPQVLTSLGKVVDSLWQGLKGAVKRIIGIFGYGEHGDKGFFENFAMIFVSLGDGLIEAVAQWVTRSLQMFMSLDFLGLEDGESVYGRIKRFFMVDIPAYAEVVFGTIKNYIASLDPIQMMKDKLSDFISAIVGIIPTWDDIKGLIIGAIPDWAKDYGGQWIIDKLQTKPSGHNMDLNSIAPVTKPTPAPEPAPVQPSFSSRANDLYNSAVSVWDRASVPNIIYAPQSNSTVNSVVTRGKSIINDIGIGATRTIPDKLNEYLLRANPY